MTVFPPDPTAIRIALFLFRFGLKLPWVGKLLRRAKNRYLLGSFYEFHLHVVHRWRDCFVGEPRLTSWESFAPAFKELCNGCRDCLAEVLELNAQRLHCTLKALVEYGEGARVVTLSRSDPCDRPPEYGMANAHLVENNTVFAAICGKSDGIRHWQPYSCFSCNDLTRHVDQFACDRQSWATWYKSTVAVPLRYRDPHNRHEYRILGFLTFDLPSTDQFVGMPDIFEHDRDRYQELLAGSSIFHVVGSMADTLVLFLRPLTKEPDYGKQAESR